MFLPRSRGTEALDSNLDCRMANMRQGLMLTSPNVKSIDISGQNKHRELYCPWLLASSQAALVRISYVYKCCPFISTPHSI
jgi:hypothetical protein